MTTPNDGTTVPAVTTENGTTSVAVETVTVEAEKTVVAPVVAPVIKTEPLADAVTSLLLSLGVSADDAKRIIESLGVTEEEDLKMLTAEMLKGVGMLPIPVSKLLAKINPVVQATSTPVDSNVELPDGAEPTKAQVNSFATAIGADPMTMMMLLNNQGGDLNLAGMIPIPTIVNGYNPKRRDMFLMFMGQVEQRLGVPIVVIDGSGSINRPLTIEYIEGLEEGRDPAENNIYFDDKGTPHEVIRAGVDAQSIYDADPLDPTKALQKSGMGIGRVNWNNVSLEVKQVAYFASTQTHEIDPTNDAHQSWLRDHMKVGVNRLAFHGQAPRAIALYNEAARTGSLPTLRVMLSRSARRQEIMPRRRRTSPADLSGIGGRKDEF